VQSIYQKLEGAPAGITQPDSWQVLASASITTSVGIKIDIWSTFSTSNTAPANNFFRLVVTPMSSGVPSVLEGAGTTLVGVNEGDGIESGAINEEYSTTPDTYTVDLQWRTTAGTANCRPGAEADSEHADILIQELTA